MSAPAIARRDYAERELSPRQRAALAPFPVAVQRLLVEAERRYRNFQRPNGKGLDSAWIGLGSPSQYRPAIAAGLMRPLHGREQPRALNWYLLTADGARLMRRLFGSRI